MIRPFLGFAAAAFWAVFLWPFGANADVCRDQWGNLAPRFAYSLWYEDMLRLNPGGVQSRTMTDEERFRFLRAYNNTPSITEANPERIEVFWVDWNSSTVGVLFVENGCVTYSASLFRAFVDSIISPNTNGWQPRRSPPPMGCEA